MAGNKVSIRTAQVVALVAIGLVVGALLLTNRPSTAAPLSYGGNAVNHCDVDVDPTCPPELDTQSSGEALDPSFATAAPTATDAPATAIPEITAGHAP